MIEDERFDEWFTDSGQSARWVGIAGVLCLHAYGETRTSIIRDLSRYWYETLTQMVDEFFEEHPNFNSHTDGRYVLPQHHMVFTINGHTYQIGVLLSLVAFDTGEKEPAFYLEDIDISCDGEPIITFEEISRVMFMEEIVFIPSQWEHLPDPPHHVNAYGTFKWGYMNGDEWVDHRDWGKQIIDVQKSDRFVWMSYRVHGHRIANNRWAKEACDPATSPERLAKLAKHKCPATAHLAVHHPNCPDLVKAEHALTRGNDFAGKGI